MRECGVHDNAQGSFVCKMFMGATCGPRGIYLTREELESAATARILAEAGGRDQPDDLADQRRVNRGYVRSSASGLWREPGTGFEGY
ncbi:MAG TPA: hypothetical protein VKF37_14025 [Chloroflexota bacterium]|nr:hypothetical protein [Chloroflexota bacterium]